MTEATQGGEGQPQETQEEREARLAAAYRAQRDGVAEDEGEPADEKPQRPEHIPEKFWDAEKGEVRVEELAKSYAELEKLKAKPADTEGEGEGEGQQPDPDAAKAQEEFAKYREGLTEKILSGTQLTDEDYAPAAARGLSREDVDTYIAGLQAMGELHKQKVYGEAGGEESYKSMLDWAKGAFSQQEIEAYNRDVHSSDAAVSLNAVRGLAARYQVANGRMGKNVVKAGSGASGDGYKSKAEMVADMQSPKYAKDSAFRAEVARKVSVARAAGVDLSH